MSDRHGANNPFFGREHTEAWKANSRARQEWPAAELELLRTTYEKARVDRRLDLAGLAAKLGRPKPSVSRKAKQMGLTDARRVKKQERSSRAKHATPEARRSAISEATKKRFAEKGHPRGMLGKRQRPEVIRRAVAASAAAWKTRSPEERAAIIDKQQATKLAKYGRINNNVGSNAYSRCKHGRRADLDNQFFRSAWEANYARFLNILKGNGQVAKWEFEAETFWFEAIRRGVRSYTPDFRVTEPTGHVYYVEVKGWMDDKSKTKIRRMRKYHPHIDFRVVDSKAYYEIERKLGGAITGWEFAT